VMKVKERFSEFIDSLPGRRLQGWRNEHMRRRHELVNSVRDVVSLIEEDTKKLQKHPLKKDSVKRRELLELLNVKKQNLLKILEAVGRFDNWAKSDNPTRGQLKRLNREEQLEHNRLAKHLKKIGIDYNGGSLESVIKAYQQSIDDDIAAFSEKYGKSGNSRETWGKKVQPGSGSRAQDRENSVEKPLDDLAM